MPILRLIRAQLLLFASIAEASRHLVCESEERGDAVLIDAIEVESGPFANNVISDVILALRV